MLGTGHLNGSFDQAQPFHSVCGSWLGAGRDHSAQLGNQQPVECVPHHQLWPSRLQVTLPSLFLSTFKNTPGPPLPFHFYRLYQQEAYMNPSASLKSVSPANVRSVF